jgi:hypothetical protein
MIKSLVLASVIAAAPLYASAAVQPKPVFVQIIVKACRPAETPLEPTNQGKSYDDETPLSATERKQLLAELGCIDVPMPMEWVNWPMTPAACIGHAGYIASMEFLRQRQDLGARSAVGGWECIFTDHQVVGAAYQ